MAARSAILKYLRVQPRSLFQNPATKPFTLSSAFNTLLTRNFSEEPSGSFLDKAEVTERIVKVIKNFEKVDPAKVTPTSHFEKDLGLDSLDTVEVIMALEEEFGFEMPDSDADKIFSVDNAIDLIASCPQAK